MKTAHFFATAVLLAGPACAESSQRRMLRSEAEFELPPVSKPVNLAALTDSIQGFFSDAPPGSASGAGKPADTKLPSQAAIQALASAASTATSDTGDAISDFLGDDSSPSAVTTSMAKSAPTKAASKAATTAAPSAKLTTTGGGDAAADAISDFLDDDAVSNAPVKSKTALLAARATPAVATSTAASTTMTTTTTAPPKAPVAGRPDSKSGLAKNAGPEDKPSQLKSDEHARITVATRVTSKPAPQALTHEAHGEAEHEKARSEAVAAAHKAVAAEVKARAEAKRAMPSHAAHQGAEPAHVVTSAHSAGVVKPIAAKLVRPASASAQQHAPAHAPKQDVIGSSEAHRDRFVHHLEEAKEINAESVGTKKTLRQLAGSKATSNEVASAKWSQHRLPRAYMKPAQTTTAAAAHMARTLKSSTTSPPTVAPKHVQEAGHKATQHASHELMATRATATTTAALTSPNDFTNVDSRASKLTTTVEAGQVWKQHRIPKAYVKPMKFEGAGQEKASMELKAELLRDRALRHRAALVSYSSDWSDDAYDIPEAMAVSTTETTTATTAVTTTVPKTTTPRVSRFARRFGFSLRSVPWQQTALQPSMTFEHTEQEPIHPAPARLINWERPIHRFWQYLGLAEPVKAPATRKVVAMLQQPVWHVAVKEKQNAWQTAKDAQEERTRDVTAESTWEALEAKDSSIEEDLRDADRSERLLAETPDAPHFLTNAEIERRNKQEGTVHFSNTWVSLEDQDEHIQKSLSSMGEDVDLNNYGALGRVQDEGMQTLAAQQASADQDAKESRGNLYHQDNAPEAKSLHDSFEQLQANDEDSEASIRNNPDLKSAM